MEFRGVPFSFMNFYFLLPFFIVLQSSFYIGDREVNFNIRLADHVRFIAEFAFRERLNSRTQCVGIRRVGYTTFLKLNHSGPPTETPTPHLTMNILNYAATYVLILDHLPMQGPNSIDPNDNTVILTLLILTCAL